jgi:hypothetical protein
MRVGYDLVNLLMYERVDWNEERNRGSKCRTKCGDIQSNQLSSVQRKERC